MPDATRNRHIEQQVRDLMGQLRFAELSYTEKRQLVRIFTAALDRIQGRATARGKVLQLVPSPSA